MGRRVNYIEFGPTGMAIQLQEKNFPFFLSRHSDQRPAYRVSAAVVSQRKACEGVSSPDRG